MLIGVAAVFLFAVTPASARAQFNLGVIMYDTGEGVLQDDAEAVRWHPSDTAASFRHRGYLLLARGSGVHGFGSTPLVIGLT